MNEPEPNRRTPSAPPPPERLDAVLFDAGMTLIHPARTVEHIYAEHAGVAVPPPPDLVRQIRHHFRELFEQARQDMATGADGYVASDEADRALWRRICLAVADRIPGLTPDPEAWFETLYAHFGQPETWQPFDDTGPALDALGQRGLALGIVSNWDSRLLQILEGLRLDVPMGTVVISARAGVRKPGREIFTRALEALGVAPEHTLMVGDSVTDDVEGAWAAGVHAVLIHRAPTPPPPGIPAIGSLTELLAWPALAR